GFFDSLFGSVADNYSNLEYPLTEEKIKQLVTQARISSLTAGEENLVERAIADRRRGDGKISLRQIYEVVRSLKYNHKISEADFRGLMKIFNEYFRRFGK
ncbi:MAG: hypothetical protein AAB390_05345, partial [Patescibacteria group bacterium]